MVVWGSIENGGGFHGGCRFGFHGDGVRWWKGKGK